MMVSQTTEQDGDASYEYTTINTVADPEIGSEEENAEKNKGQTEPRRLKEFTTFTFIELCWDVFVTLTPVAFLVLGTCALSLDRQPLSVFGANIQKGSAFAPTIFPIVFAAIMARSMRGFALRRAEKGTELGLLEQLTGSQSLASAVERFVSLRRFNITGIIILLVWLLSPLGGQSSLRILSFTNTFVISQGQIHFFNTSSIPDTSVFSSANDYSSFLVSALLDASLMQPDQIANSPVDQWNNVKIPRLHDLSPFTNAAPGNPWISVNPTTKKTWSSLTGLMIQQLPVAGRSNFTLESAYLDIACSNSTRIDEDPPVSYQKAFKYSGLKIHNASWPFYGPKPGRYENVTSSFFLDTGSLKFLSEYYEASSENGPINSPLNLLYGSNLAQNQFMDLYNCSVMTARVESDITCHGSSCAVNRMRRSEIYTKSPFVMPFGWVTYHNMLSYLPFAMGTPHAGTISPIENYLLGSNKPLAGRLGPILPDFSSVPGQVFSERLTTIFNTVWQASLALGSIPLGAEANYTAYDRSYMDESSFPSKPRTTTITTEFSVYAANHLFSIILIVIALILQLCAIVGLVLKYSATAPDILGYVSTMTMENPHVKVPSGGNTLDGIERARYLQKVKVQLADVHWDQVQGHVAFRSVENDVDFAKGKLSKKKFYV